MQTKYRELKETYWNVKCRSRFAHELFPSINRNILECKDIASQNTAKSQEVLIETYWNVK